MDTETLNRYANEMQMRVAANLEQKGSTDYATSEDRLYNFHAAAPILGSAEQACLAYATKHFLSICKLVRDGDVVPKELALEKLGDLATYMVLLYALTQERLDDGARPRD